MGAVNRKGGRMKRLFATALAALALSSSAVAAPPPGEPADPFTNYILTRILPNGNERVLETFEVTSWGDQELLIRAVAFEAVRQNRTNNPSWRLVLYGPIDPPSTYWTDGDRIWTSDTQPNP